MRSLELVVGLLQVGGRTPIAGNFQASQFVSMLPPVLPNLSRPSSRQPRLCHPAASQAQDCRARDLRVRRLLRTSPLRRAVHLVRYALYTASILIVAMLISVSLPPPSTFAAVREEPVLVISVGPDARHGRPSARDADSPSLARVPDLFGDFFSKKANADEGLPAAGDEFTDEKHFNLPTLPKPSGRRQKTSFVTAAVDSVGPAVVRIDTERLVNKLPRLSPSHPHPRTCPTSCLHLPSREPTPRPCPRIHSRTAAQVDRPPLEGYLFPGLEPEGQRRESGQGSALALALAFTLTLPPHPHPHARPHFRQWCHPER